MVYQVAPGNVTTQVLCYDQENAESMIISMGSCAVAREMRGKQEDKIYYKEKDYKFIEDFNSLPFQIDFFIPVIKLTCGDAFSALLTGEGRVHTWGYNRFGELGIDSESIILAMNPD